MRYVRLGLLISNNTWHFVCTHTHGYHLKSNIYGCVAFSKREPYGMCFEAFCCRFFDTGIYFNVIWFIIFNILGIWAIFIEADNNLYQAVQVRKHQQTYSHTESEMYVWNKSIALSEKQSGTRSILDMLHIYDIFKVCFISVICCKLTCYILIARPFDSYLQ